MAEYTPEEIEKARAAIERIAQLEDSDRGGREEVAEMLIPGSVAMVASMRQWALGQPNVGDALQVHSTLERALEALRLDVGFSPFSIAVSRLLSEGGPLTVAIDDLKRVLG